VVAVDLINLMDAKSKSPRSAASIGRTDSRHCRGTDPSALQRMTASALTLSINASYQLLMVLEVSKFLRHSSTLKKEGAIIMVGRALFSRGPGAGRRQ